MHRAAMSPSRAAVTAVATLPWRSACSDLVLDIDLGSETFDGVDGTSVTVTACGGTGFGAFNASDAPIDFRLPSFGPTSIPVTGILFDFRAGGTRSTAGGGLMYCASRPGHGRSGIFNGPSP